MKNRHAFTLIELLVVISIIALLISILLPALSSARESSRSIKCLSNLRSLNTGLYSYAADHDGRIVHAGADIDANGTADLFWQEAISVHLDFDGQTIPAGGSVFDTAPWENTILACPSMVVADPPADTRPYGANLRIQPGPLGPDANPANSGKYQRLDLVKNLADTMIFGDAPTQGTVANTSFIRWRSHFSRMLRGTQFFEFERHHGGRSVNMSFLDGHAESRTGDEMEPITQDTTYVTADKFFWYGGLR